MSSKRVQLIALHVFFYAAFATVRSLFGPLPIIALFVLGALLIWISVIDVERFEIPDLASGLLFASGLIFQRYYGHDLAAYLAGAVLWSALFWIVGIGYARLRGWDGLGFGDVKLIAGIAMWLGFTQTTTVVFASALTGILVIVGAKLVRGGSMADIGTTAVAFGPFLCLSAWVIWLF